LLIPHHRTMNPSTDRFWETTALIAMTPEQWESLCNDCAKSCLEKLEDVDTGRTHYTNVACRLLELDTCRCADYAKRARIIPSCIILTPAILEQPRWLSATCAYRLVAENRPLPAWHPLLTGDPGTVQAAGASLHGRVINEGDVDPLIHHLVD